METTTIKSKNYRQEWADSIVKKALSEGLRVWLGGGGEHGIFADKDGKNVVSFEVRLLTCSFSGNYWSKKDGTGWQICDEMPETLASLLSAVPRAGINYTSKKTLDEYMKIYGKCCKYVEQM